MSDLTIALKIVGQTNELLSKLFQTLGTGVIKLKINRGGAASIANNADITSNNFITKQIKKYFPNDDIVSEEANKIPNPKKNVWYIDPLDGTTNFTYGLREFGVCLARFSQNKGDINIIGLPLAKEIYWVKNKQAFLNGQQIFTARKKRSDRHLLFICDGHSLASKRKFVSISKKMNLKKFRTRVFASASVELSAVAAGRADGCIFQETRPWDALAGAELVRAAGGKVTNFLGANWTINDATLIASNGLIHNELLALTK